MWSASATMPTTDRAATRIVLLCVSPLAATRHVMAAVAASVAAGNRTLVSFPAGVSPRTRVAVRGFAGRTGGHAVAVVTGADLAGDPDAELAHLVSVDSAEVSSGHDAVRHDHVGAAARRDALASLFSDSFPTAEWTARAGSRR